jgi:hypothetical protein
VENVIVIRNGPWSLAELLCNSWTKICEGNLLIVLLTWRRLEAAALARKWDQLRQSRDCRREFIPMISWRSQIRPCKRTIEFHQLLFSSSLCFYWSTVSFSARDSRSGAATFPCLPPGTHHLETVKNLCPASKMSCPTGQLPKVSYLFEDPCRPIRERIFLFYKENLIYFGVVLIHLGIPFGF